VRGEFERGDGVEGSAKSVKVRQGGREYQALLVTLGRRISKISK
jgi:hypothetical protein